jgi:transcriptional regulator with XRE-family HTH domain
LKKAKDASQNSLLRAAREHQKWTQEEVAEKIGTTSVTISRWENGVIFPSRSYRKKLCELYGKSLEELGLSQEDDDEPARPSTIFPFNEPLLEPEEMYGRERERTTLITRTLRKASTSIVGRRRIGKTWLVQYLRLVAPKVLGTHFHIGYLDATTPRCRTVEGFSIEALTKLGLPIPAVPNGLTSLDDGLQEFTAKKHVPILCVDEFEAFSKNKQEFNVEFFQGLRAMTHTSDLVLIAISKKPLYRVVGADGETSGFSNIFEQITLQPFDARVTEQFIRDKSSKAGFTEREAEYLWEYGKEDENFWSPIRLQLAGKILLEEQDQVKHSQDFRRLFEQRFEEIYQGLV